MKLKKIPKKAKRGISAALAVVLAATAMGPLFSVMSSATFASLNHIEEIKQQKNEIVAPFNIAEIVPDTSESVMNYYVDGYDTIGDFAEAVQKQAANDSSLNSSTRQAKRLSLMNNGIYNALINKGILSETVGSPLTLNGGYQEFYPWEAAPDSSNTERPVKLELDEPDTKIVTGDYERVDIENGEIGNYELNATFKFVPDDAFNIEDWKNNARSSASGSPEGMTVTVDDGKIHCDSHAYGSSNQYYDFYTGYGESGDFYNMPLVPGATYTVSFDAARTNNIGGQFFVFMLDSNYRFCYLTENSAFKKVYKNTSGQVTESDLNEGPGAFFIAHDQGSIVDGHYEYTFTVPARTNTANNGTGAASVPAYCQFRFGTCTKNATGTVDFSNIHIYGRGNFVQSINHFQYFESGEGLPAGAYYYDVTPTALCTRPQWESLAENVAIYEKVESNGSYHYEFMGVTGVDEINVTQSLALNESNPHYFTLEVNTNPQKEMYGTQQKIAVASQVWDSEHRYMAVQNQDETYFDDVLIKAVPVYDDVTQGSGYFVSDSETLEYTPGEGRYDFEEKPDGRITTTITSSVVYYTKGVICNDWFKSSVMDCYDGDAYPNFFVTLDVYSPESFEEDEDYSSYRFRDLIVITGGAGVVAGNSKFKSDIPVSLKNAVIEAANPDNKVPVVVDVGLIDPTNTNGITKADFPNLYSLIETLADDVTASAGTSIKTGGVRNNIYAYNSSHIGTASQKASVFATKYFTTEIQNSTLIASPYYDVYDEISDENLFRQTYKDNENLITPVIASQASALRSIINYAGRRVRVLIDDIRVLDIEPYTSKPYAMFTSHEVEMGMATLSAMDVIKWLPESICQKVGDKYIYNQSREIKNEADAAQVIKITTMSVAELNTWNENITENFDLVYIGTSVDNLVSDDSHPETNRATRDYGSWMVKYNDQNITGSGSAIDGLESSGLLYTSIGDTYVEGNINYDYGLGQMIGGTIEGDTLAGLLRSDYVKIPLVNAWNLPASHVFETRANGNDITEEIRNELEEFAAAGKPVVFANKLCEVPLSDDYYIDITGTSHYRRKTKVDKTLWIFGGTEIEQDFCYFIAHLNGALPASVTAEWKWYYQGDNGSFQEIKSKKEAGNKGEPIDEVYDPVRKEWFSTLGYITYDGVNSDGSIKYSIGYTNTDDNKMCYDGMTIPDPDSSNVCQQTPADSGDFYAVVTLKYTGNSATKRQMYDGKQITSARYRLKEKTDKKFTLSYNWNSSGSGSTEHGGGTKTLTITPNPFMSEYFGTPSQTKNHSAGTVNYNGKDENEHVKLAARYVNNRTSWSTGGEKDKENDDCGGHISVNYTASASSLTYKVTCGEGHYTKILWARDYKFDYIRFRIRDSVYCFGTSKFVSDVVKGDFTAWSSGSHDIYPKYLKVEQKAGTQIPVVAIGNDLQEGQYKVDMDVVDNTSYLYAFMSQAYNDVVATQAEINTARAQGFILENRTGLDNVMTVFEISEDSGYRLGESLQVSKGAPRLIVSEDKLESYDEKNPKSLTNNTLRIEFRVNCDTNLTSSEYFVRLYLDSNHDAVYSTSELVTITTLKDGAAIADKLDGTFIAKSSTTDELKLHIYTLEKQIPSTYQGVLPWKLEIVDTEQSYFHDSYKGYAYVNQDTATVIKALQVLPADQWSNNATESRYWGTDFKNFTIRGAWTSTDNRDHPENGNAYVGSVFMGIDSKYNYGKTSNDYNFGDAFYTPTQKDEENDAFYQLTKGSDAKLKRTVYYEDISGTTYSVNGQSTSGDGTVYFDSNGRVQFSHMKYRTHVVLWINPEGEQVAQKNELTGETVKDYFGREVMEYEDCDFKVDIALTDIYELNNYVFYNEQSADYNKDFLNNYDMLILGFGDSYGKTALANVVQVGVADIATTQGFNQWTCFAVEDYINSNKPVLFCHDTLNHQTNFINYWGNNLGTKFTEFVNTVSRWYTQTLLPAVKKAWTSVKNWFKEHILGQEVPPEPPTPADIPDENTLDSNVQESRVKNGYYNNLIMRVPLMQDRYGITYSIKKVMDTKESSGANKGKTYWQTLNYKGGHEYSWLLGSNAADNSTDSAKKGGYLAGEKELLGEGYSMALQPGTAQTFTTANKDTVVKYTYYADPAKATRDGTTSGQYESVESTNRKGTVNKVNKSYNNYNDYTITDYKNNTSRSMRFGGQPMATYVYQTQGFTTWTMVRYGCNQDDYRSTYLPIGIRSRNSNHEPVMTTAITQVNKGAITTYPYDINTAAFGGTTGNADGKIPILPTHEQVYQANLNHGETTVWYCLADPSGTTEANKVYDVIPNDGVNSYYIYTSGNLTYTGAGHSNMFTLEEAKLFINTLVAAYRVTAEKPMVYFRDNTDSSNIGYKLLTADRTYADTQSNDEVEDSVVYRDIYQYSLRGGVDSNGEAENDYVAAVKVVNPNVTGSETSELTLRFGKGADTSTNELSSLFNVGTLYTEYKNNTLGGTTVSPSDNAYTVRTDTTYYFVVPQSAIDELVDSYSTIIYAQTTVSEGGTVTPGEIKSLELRIVGLENLT